MLGQQYQAVSHKQDDHTSEDTGHTREDTAKMTHTISIRPKRNGQMRCSIRLAVSRSLSHSHPSRFSFVCHNRKRLSISISSSRGKLPCGEEAMRWMRLGVYLSVSIYYLQLCMCRVARSRDAAAKHPSLEFGTFIADSQTTVSSYVGSLLRR